MTLLCLDDPNVKCPSIIIDAKYDIWSPVVLIFINGNDNIVDFDDHEYEIRQCFKTIVYPPFGYTF
jgi:hypothetical protein